MGNLYTNLSAVYEAMYQSFNNYDEEYEFYSNILRKYNCHSLLETGCGTGNLASRFIKNNFDYTGMDFSEGMLNIAKKNNAQGKFMAGDMRAFELETKVDACIFTGRTISHLIQNKEVLDTLQCIHKNLKSPGIVCFDCIDANQFVPITFPSKKMIHKVNFQNKTYLRESFWEPTFTDSWSFVWNSFFYYENENGQLTAIGEDTTAIRTFTKDEMIIFLQLAGFHVLEMIAKPSYAFDTFVMVAKKIN